MDKFLLLLLLLEVLPIVFFQIVAPSTLCMVCNIFKKGRCIKGYGNCTMDQGRGCRTRDIFIFNEIDGWFYNHTELDCSNECKAWKLIHGNLKVSSYCCNGKDFCNRFQGKLLELKIH